MAAIEDEDVPGQEAAAWFLRLRSLGVGAQEYRQFEQWRDADPAHRRAYADVEAIWSRLGSLPPQAYRRRPVLRRSLTVAGATAVLGAAGFGLLWRPAHDVVTGAGQRVEVSLPDGTRLVVDAASGVRSADVGELRTATLVAGQVLAVVAETDRPFELRVEPVASIRLPAGAAGTVVAKRVGQGARLAVLAASAPAEVRLPGRTSLSLRPDTMLALPTNSPRPVPADPDAVAGWRTGRLVYRAAPLPEVVEDLARYRGGSVSLAGVGLERLRVTAALSSDDPDGALRALEASLPIRIQRSPGVAVVHPA